MRIPRTKRGVTAYIVAIAILTFSLFQTANSKPLKIAKAPTTNNVTNITEQRDEKSTDVLGTTGETHTVTKVIDGDTFQIETGQKVRFIGIDAPETVDPRRSVGCFGKEASDHLKTLLLNKEVTLVKDVSETDSFRRLLRYVYLDNVFINEQLVKEGFATSKTFPPDVKYQTILKEAELNAFTNSQGLWGKTCNSLVK